MARKPNAKKTNRSQWGDSEISFASRRLSREEGEAFLEWEKSGTPEFSIALSQIIGEGYKVAFKLDFNNSAMVVAFTQQDERHPHYNVYLTSRSDDPVEAFYLNCFKVWQLYPGKAIVTDERLNELWG